MPLVDITLAPGVPEQQVGLIGETVQKALVEALRVPADDHFQIHSAARTLVYDPAYLGVERSDGFLVIRVFLARGRTVTQKKALYRELAQGLENRCGVRPQDVFVTLVEVGKEDFSFGCGLAQYADSHPSHLAPTSAVDE
jgi:phenylpyruvate tautomerase PptA (4-oxalocrotonate tautomerase family)